MKKNNFFLIVLIFLTKVESSSRFRQLHCTRVEKNQLFHCFLRRDLQRRKFKGSLYHFGRKAETLGIAPGVLFRLRCD